MDHDLHETYSWKINAALEEDRHDLVWTLVEDYRDAAPAAAGEAARG